jgi:hypothetical protein
MTVGAASFAKLGFEYIENCSFRAVRVTGLLAREAAGNLRADKADPLFCDKTDSSDTTMAVLVRVGETENPVDAHHADFSPELRSRDGK